MLNFRGVSSLMNFGSRSYPQLREMKVLLEKCGLDDSITVRLGHGGIDGPMGGFWGVSMGS